MNKRIPGLIFSALSVFVSINRTFAYEDSKTTYLPGEGITTEEINWARQPDGTPWCFPACMKIVLKDLKEKHQKEEPPKSVGEKVDRILSPSVSEKPFLKRREAPEERIICELLLANCAVGSGETINKANKSVRSNFWGKTNAFFSSCLQGKINEKAQELDAEKVFEGSTKISLLSGLLGVAPRDGLAKLWENLETDEKKMFVPRSNQDLLNSLEGSTGLKGEIYDVKYTRDSVEECKTSVIATLQDIANEIINHRMVVLFFKSRYDPSDCHACVAYRTTYDKSSSNKWKSITVFNPWGNILNLYATNIEKSIYDPYFFNISADPARGKSHYLMGYAKFNY